MARRRVLACHVILSAYGFWLPNDPRGSWSTWVRSFDLYRAGGAATKVDTHRSVAHRPHDREKRLAVKRQLAHPPVRLTGVQAREVARGFASCDYDVRACCVMPDHAHLVLGRGELSVESMVNQFKGAATRQLTQAGLHPFDGKASPWARRHWQVFLWTDEDVERAVKYVEDNPVRAGLPRQHWSFVKRDPG